MLTRWLTFLTQLTQNCISILKFHKFSVIIAVLMHIVDVLLESCEYDISRAASGLPEHSCAASGLVSGNRLSQGISRGTVCGGRQVVSSHAWKVSSSQASGDSFVGSSTSIETLPS